jgi:polyisoprenyl-teichoic acid--peptidoglycan teichoic acid transferase
MPKKNRLRMQLLLVSFLSVVFIMTMVVIYLGATLFRDQLPFFQLIDAEMLPAVQNLPEPEPNSGVEDLDPEEGVRLFMILGSDFRPQSGYRTDTIILVAVDSQSGKVSMVSFPRDLWINIPGHGEGRINTVMQLGSFSLLSQAMQTNFGIFPTQYAMIDMEGFLSVIDALGGITIETDVYTADACESSLDPDRWCEVGPGIVSMNSELALWYVRARYNSSDFDRMRRTQEVIRGVAERAVSPAGLLKTPRLLEIYESEVESNITPSEALSMMRWGISKDSRNNLQRFSIGPDEVTSWTTPGGAAVLLPNTQAIQTILRNALIFE